MRRIFLQFLSIVFIKGAAIIQYGGIFIAEVIYSDISLLGKHRRESTIIQIMKRAPKEKILSRGIGHIKVNLSVVQSRQESLHQDLMSAMEDEKAMYALKYTMAMVKAWRPYGNFFRRKLVREKELPQFLTLWEFLTFYF